MKGYKIMEIGILGVIAVMSVMLSSSIAIADDIAMTTTVSSAISATFQYSSVAFGTLSDGSNNNVAPNQASGVYNVTMDTNADFQLDVNGTSFSGATSSFGIGNLTMDSDPSAGSLAEGSSVQVGTTGSSATIDTSIPYTTTVHFHGFWLDIPNSQYAESYTANVTMTYSNV